jgi:hypothetical protein
MRIGQHYFTWCPKGIGCEDLPGYQTRAKSSSIDEGTERAIRHYASRYELPRSLGDLKMRAEDLSSEELQACPTATHFYRISRDLLGLTRVRLARKQAGRGGNFFAHTFVFPPAVLVDEAFDPFALERSGAFEDDVEDSAPKTLPDLAAFKSLPSASDRQARRLDLARHLDTNLLRRVLSCVLASSQPQNRRPIILCPQEVQDAALIIEAVVGLLPPHYRDKVGFGTYEPDPYRVAAQGEGVEPPVAYLVGTIRSDEGGHFQFREDEYQTRFYVFDRDCSQATGKIMRGTGDSTR